MPFLCGWIFLGTHASYGSGIVEGYVTDSLNQPLPFCNVYLRNSGYAGVTNEQGYYRLQAPEGEYTIVFQFIGYQRQERPIVLTTTPLRLDIVLQAELMELETLVVSANREDPAYPIIRKAIEKRAAHLEEINAFTCSVYMKGLQKLTEAPEQLMGVKLNTILDVDSNNTGIVYLSESSSTFHFQQPDKTREIMHASLVSGSNSSFSWNDAASMQMNFYKNLETLEGFSQRGFVSPVADNALFFYTYRLIHQTTDQQHTIYTIEVTPKRKTDPVYQGIIYITDDDYRFTGVQMELSKSNGIEFIDTFRVEQEYYYADPQHLVLLSNKFSFNYNFFGIQGNGYFHGYYSNYTIEPVFPAGFFTGERTRIESGANQQDSLYWSTIRPMQLTREETDDYLKKESLAQRKETLAYQDSADRVFNSFRWSHLIGGYIYRSTPKKIQISTNPIFDLLQFNTVEGYVIQPAVTISKQLDTRRRIAMETVLRYSSASPGLMANANIVYRPDPFTKARYSISGGSDMRQYNARGISNLLNTAYTLLLEENYLKLYGRDYIQVDAERELWANGLYLGSGLQYANRYRYSNSANLSPWIEQADNAFSENNTFAIADAPVSVEGEMPDILSWYAKAKYVIRQTYITYPDEKFVYDPEYPVLTAQLKLSAAPAAFEHYRFGVAELQMEDVIQLRLAGSLQVSLRSSVMFSDTLPDIADQLHAAGNATHFSRLDENGFFLLPYYLATNDRMLHTAHVEWHTDGFLFRKLPLFKQLKMDPVFSAHFLHSPVTGVYTEMAAGVEHLFNFLRIDVAYTPYSSDIYTDLPTWRILAGIGF